MLMSDENNDTAVLLGSFELEQVLEEMPPGELRPKVGGGHRRNYTLVRGQKRYVAVIILLYRVRSTRM